MSHEKKIEFKSILARNSFWTSKKEKQVEKKRMKLGRQFCEHSNWRNSEYKGTGRCGKISRERKKTIG
jgi:hypothetical protein